MARPNWLKKLFTDFITFTVKVAIKGQVSLRETELTFHSSLLSKSHVHVVLLCSQMQICKEINKAANILADFIQDTAGVCVVVKKRA